MKQIRQHVRELSRDSLCVVAFLVLIQIAWHLVNPDPSSASLWRTCVCFGLSFLAGEIYSLRYRKKNQLVIKLSESKVDPDNQPTE